MTIKNWKRELDRLLEIFEIESTISLSKISHHFEGLGRPFDDKFREYFLDKSIQRLNTSFDIIQFGGCSKTPTEVTPNTSSSTGVADIPKQVKVRSNAFSESNNPAESFEEEHIDTDRDIESMVKAFVKRELNRLLEIFELESTISLSKINHHFERLDRPFDNEFRDYFLEMSTQRLNASFDIVLFDGCSKTPTEVTPNTSSSKQAANVPNKVKIKPNVLQKYNNDIDLDIENFVGNFVKREFNVKNEAEHHPKNISDITGGKKEFNVTNANKFDSKNVSHVTTSEKTDRAKVSKPLENLWDNLLAQMQPSIDSIVKLFNFKCNECGYATNNKSHLTRHQKIHDFQNLHGIEQDPITKLFKCPHCDHQYVKWYSLKYHLTVSHRSNRPLFKCEQCSRLFDEEIKKDRHAIRCKGFYYECYLCKQYVTYYIKNMRAHLRTHSGIRPLQCQICDRYFRHKYSLSRHLNAIHGCASNHNQ